MRIVVSRIARLFNIGAVRRTFIFHFPFSIFHFRNLFSQISLLDGIIIQQIGCLAGLDNFAGFEDVAAVRDGQRLLCVLLYEQDGGACLGHFLDDLEDFAYEQRRQTHRRLIEQQDARNYDLSLNSGVLGFDGTVEEIIKYMEVREQFQK